VQAQASLKSRAPVVIRHLFAVCVLALCTAAHAGASTAPTAAKSQLIKSIEGIYSAATRDDPERFQQFATADFRAIEGTQSYTGDQWMRMIKASHGSGKNFLWHVTKPRFDIQPETAMITFTINGSVAGAPNRNDRSYRQSATLRKQAGNWRVHSLIAAHDQ
jgi:hypothetical protein